MQRHYVTIDPYISVSSRNFKQHKPVGLKVLNARSSNNIAQRSGPDLSFYSPKFTLRAKSDLTDVIRQKISEGLLRIGFKPKIIEKIPHKTLRIEIIRLRSKYEEKLPFLDVRVQAAFRAHCTYRGKSYSKNYSHEKKIISTPVSTFPNEKLINGTLSETLKKMFEDEKLISCLAQ